MSIWVTVINDVVVSLFGSVLSAAFAGMLKTRRERWIFWCCTVALLLLQGWIFSVQDAVFLRQIYPLIFHLPLILMLSFLTGKPLWSVVSVLNAYLCCQLRRWLALFIVALASGGELLQDIIELAVTVPLLFLLLRFVAPAVCQLEHQPKSLQLQFGVIPAVYYGFDYMTMVYTDLLSSGGAVVVEFMPFVCCAAYLAFLLYHSVEEQKRSQLQQVKKNLDIQLSQSVREISMLRESQELARRYRHDLRHHLQYVSACVHNGQTEQAQNYIAGICREIEAQTVQRYCENEAANLILSAFAGRAKSSGVDMKIQGTLPAAIRLSDSDLCVLLSNALENALHACIPFVDAGIAATIEVQFYQREGKFFLQVVNPCEEGIRFANGIPVTDRPDHGIGVQSICAISDRYGGIYSFTVQNGNFILRLSI